MAKRVAVLSPPSSYDQQVDSPDQENEPQSLPIQRAQRTFTAPGGVDPRAYTNPSLRNLYSGEIATLDRQDAMAARQKQQQIYQQSRIQQKAQEDAAKAAQVEKNRLAENNFLATGQKYFKDEAGNIQPLIVQRPDASGKPTNAPVFTPHTSEIQHDEQGRPFAYQRTESGETKKVFKDAGIVTNELNPTDGKLYWKRPDGTIDETKGIDIWQAFDSPDPKLRMKAGLTLHQQEKARLEAEADRLSMEASRAKQLSNEQLLKARKQMQQLSGRTDVEGRPIPPGQRDKARLAELQATISLHEAATSAAQQAFDAKAAAQKFKTTVTPKQFIEDLQKRRASGEAVGADKAAQAAKEAKTIIGDAAGSVFGKKPTLDEAAKVISARDELANRVNSGLVAEKMTLETQAQRLADWQTRGVASYELPRFQQEKAEYESAVAAYKAKAQHGQEQLNLANQASKEVVRQVNDNTISDLAAGLQKASTATSQNVSAADAATASGTTTPEDRRKVLAGVIPAEPWMPGASADAPKSTDDSGAKRPLTPEQQKLAAEADQSAAKAAETAKELLKLQGAAHLVDTAADAAEKNALLQTSFRTALQMLGQQAVPLAAMLNRGAQEMRKTAINAGQATYKDAANKITIADAALRDPKVFDTVTRLQTVTDALRLDPTAEHLIKGRQALETELASKLAESSALAQAAPEAEALTKDMATFKDKANQLFPSGFDYWKELKPLNDRMKALPPALQEMVQFQSDINTPVKAWESLIGGEGREGARGIISSLVPFASMGSDAMRAMHTYDIAQKLEAGTPLTEDEQKFIKGFLIWESRPRSFGAKLTDVIAGSVKFGAELAVGAPAGLAVRGATEGALAKATAYLAQKGIVQRLSAKFSNSLLSGTVKNLSLRAIAGVSDYATRSFVVHSPAMLARSLQELSEGINVKPDDTGKITAFIDPSVTRPSVGKAVATGIVDTLIQDVSEGSGAWASQAIKGGLTKAGSVLAKYMPTSWVGAAGRSAAVLAALGKKAGNIPVAGMLARALVTPKKSKLASSMNWHGLLGEFLEERVADVAGLATGTSDGGIIGAADRGKWGEAADQALLEGAAFGLMGAGFNIPTFAMNEIRTRTLARQHLPSLERFNGTLSKINAGISDASILQDHPEKELMAPKLEAASKAIADAQAEFAEAKGKSAKFSAASRLSQALTDRLGIVSNARELSPDETGRRAINPATLAAAEHEVDQTVASRATQEQQMAANLALAIISGNLETAPDHELAQIGLERGKEGALWAGKVKDETGRLVYVADGKPAPTQALLDTIASYPVLRSLFPATAAEAREEIKARVAAEAAAAQNSPDVAPSATGAPAPEKREAAGAPTPEAAPAPAPQAPTATKGKYIVEVKTKKGTEFIEGVEADSAAEARAIVAKQGRGEVREARLAEAPKPAAQPDAKEQIIKGKLSAQVKEQAIAKSTDPKARAGAVKIVQQLAPAFDGWQDVLERIGVTIETSPVTHSTRTPMGYFHKEKKIILFLPSIASALKSGVKADWTAKAFSEEVIHAVAYAIDVDAAGIWNAAGPLQKLLEGSYLGLTDAAEKGHELIRMFLQKRIVIGKGGKVLLDGKATEETAPDSFIQKILDALKQLLDYFKAIDSGAVAAPELKAAVDALESAIKMFDSATSAATDAKPGKEAANGSQKEGGEKGETLLTPETKTPPDSVALGRSLLAKLAEISHSHIPAVAVDAIIGGTFNGDFRGPGNATLDVDSDGNVVLRRFARDRSHLIKDGQRSGGAQDLWNTSEHHGGGNGVPTIGSARDVAGVPEGSYADYAIEGVFKIPSSDFLKLAQSGEIILGNIGESEVVISPAVAAQYIASITNRTSEDTKTPPGSGQTAGGVNVAAEASPEAPGTRSFAPGLSGTVTDTAENATDWVSFDNSLGIPREDMPQIKSEHRGAMANFLRSRGVEWTEEEVDPNTLTASQSMFSRRKVEKAKKWDEQQRAILVSRDNYVIDGHHQWQAAKELGQRMPIIRLDANAVELLNTIRQFPSAKTAQGEKPSAIVQAGEPPALELSELEKEQNAWRINREAELLEKVDREFMDVASGNADAMASLKEDAAFPVLFNTSGKTMRGRLRSRTQAAKEGRNPANYNGSDGVPGYFFGGTMAPDQIAGELSEQGLLPPDATADDLWNYIDKMLRSIDRFKGRIDAYKEARRQARKQAAAESKNYFPKPSTAEELLADPDLEKIREKVTKRFKSKYLIDTPENRALLLSKAATVPLGKPYTIQNAVDAGMLVPVTVGGKAYLAPKPEAPAAVAEPAPETQATPVAAEEPAPEEPAATPAATPAQTEEAARNALAMEFLDWVEQNPTGGDSTISEEGKRRGLTPAELRDIAKLIKKRIAAGKAKLAAPADLALEPETGKEVMPNDRGPVSSPNPTDAAPKTPASRGATPSTPQAAPSANPLSPAQQKLKEKLDAKTKGKIPPTQAISTAETYDSDFEPSEIGSFVEIAQELIAEGIDTPEALAETMRAIGHVQFTAAMWSAFGMTGAKYRAIKPDWPAVYAQIDAPQEKAPAPPSNPQQAAAAARQSPSAPKMPDASNVKISDSADRKFKARVQLAADTVEAIRSGYDGVGRLMEDAFLSGGVREAAAFREWLLRQKPGLSDAARETLDAWSPPGPQQASAERPALPKALIQALLRSGHEVVPSGPSQAGFRQLVMRQIGSAVPKSQAGVNAVEKALAAYLGADTNTHPAGIADNIRQKLRDMLAANYPEAQADAAPAADTPPAETKAAEKAASKPDDSPIKLKAQKEFLIAAVDEAIKAAPDDFTGTVPVDADLALIDTVRYYSEEDRDDKFQADAFAKRQNAVLAPLVEKFGLRKDATREEVEAAARMERTRQMRNIEIEVPGDGTFRIVNTKKALREFKKLAAKFPVAAAKPDAPGPKPIPKPTPVPAEAKIKTAADMRKVMAPMASTDPTREPILYIWSDGSKAVATDGRRLLIVATDKLGGTEKAPALVHAQTGKPPDVPLEETGNGRFPNWRAVRPDATKFKHEATLDTAGMAKLLIQAQAVMDDDEGEVKVWQDDSGAVGISAEAEDVGSFSSGSDPETSEFVAFFNAQLLLDGITAARRLGHDTVKFAWSKNNVDGPVVLTAPGFEYVLMPMRLHAWASAHIQSQRHPEASSKKPKPLRKAPVTPKKSNGESIDNRPIQGTYGGWLAETPQFMRDSLATAQAMAAAGKTSEEIRSVTGWFPGKYDGKMRWEIPDEGARLNPDWVAWKKSAAADTAGEIEARDVQARLGFTPEQRKTIEPYSSENIAKEDAIVMFGGNGAQMSEENGGKETRNAVDSNHDGRTTQTIRPPSYRGTETGEEHSLVSAASYVRGSDGRGRRAGSFKGQVERLFAWAQANAIPWVNPEDVPDRTKKGVRQGGEHVVHFNRREQTWTKWTVGHHSGFTFVARKGTATGLDAEQKIRSMDVIEPEEADPADYLERIALTERVLGVPWRITGIGIKEGAVFVRTSQANVKGTAAKDKAIQQWLKDKGFQGVMHGVYYNEGQNIVISDLHGENFKQTPKGIVIFDAVINFADEETRAFLREKLGLPEDSRPLQGTQAVTPAQDAAYLQELAEIEREAKADGTWMKAPNGKPSKLTARQWVQVRTANFKAWFGDSRVVDENGEPLVVFKGMPKHDWRTGAEIDVIDSPNGEWAGFFSSSQEVAAKFAEAFRTMLRPSPDTTVVQAFLRITDPFDIDAKGKMARDVHAVDRINPARRDSLMSTARRVGHDGIVIRNTEDEATVYIPFDPTQIKSATGNSGAFDPASDSILRAQSFADYLANDGIDIDELDALRALAEAEVPGEFETGDPRLAISTVGPDIRAIDERRKGYLEDTAETIEEWDALAREMLNKDRSGTLERIIKIGLRGGKLDKIDTRAAQMLISEESAKPSSLNHRRKLQQLIWAYRNTGTEAARDFAARRDMAMTPYERGIVFLNKVIFEPPPAVAKKIETAPTEQAKLALLEADQARIAKIEAELKKMGISFDDIFRGEVRLTLIGSQIEQNILGEFEDRQRQAIALIQQGNVSFKEIAQRTGMSVKEAEATYDKFVDDLRKKTFAKFKSGAKASQFQYEQTSLALNTQRIQPAQDVSDADADREFQKVLRMMGIPPKDLVGKVTVKKVLRKKLFQTPRPDIQRDGESAEDFKKRLRGFRGNYPDPAQTSPEYPNGRPIGELPGMEAQNQERDYAPGERGAGTETGRLALEDPVNYNPDLSGEYELVNVMSVVDLEDSRTLLRLMRLAQAASPASGMDMMKEYYLMSILSGLRTNAVNVIGNTLNVGFRTLGVRLVESALNLATGNNLKSLATFGEFQHLVKGLIGSGGRVGALPRAWAHAVAAWADEADYIEFDFLNRDTKAFVSDWAEARRPAIPGRLGRILRAPARGLMFADSFFKSSVAVMEVGAQAYRLGRNKGLKGEALQEFIAAETNTPGSDSYVAAVDQARKATFQEELPGWLKTLQTARNGSLLFTMLFPFIRTPYNILRQGYRISPVGAFGLLRHLAKAGLYRIKNGTPMVTTSPQLAQRTAEQAIGWMLTMILFGAAEGDDEDGEKDFLITGSSTGNWGDRQQALKERAGLKPLTIKIGGIEIDYSRFEPIATSLSSIVDSSRAVKHAKATGDAAAALKKLGGWTEKQVESKSFLQGVSVIAKFLDNLRNFSKSDAQVKSDIPAEESTTEQDDAEGLTSLLKRQFLAAWVPNILKQGARATDDTYRDTSNGEWWDDFWPSKDAAPPRINLGTGEDTKKTGNAVTRLILPDSQRIDTVAASDQMLLAWNRSQSPEYRWAPAAQKNKLSYRDGDVRKSRDLTGRETAWLTRRTVQLAQEKIGTLDPEQIKRPTKEDVKAVKDAYWQAADEARDELRIKLSLPTN